MILDDTTITSMAQQAADYSGKSQTIYKRADGSFLFCAEGNVTGLNMVLKPNEQIQYIKLVKPTGSNV